MSEEELIDLLEKGDRRAYAYVYKNYFSMVCPFILQNSGTLEEAKEVFNDAFLVLINKVQNEDMKFTAKVSTYLFAVARLQWLDRLRKKQAKKTLKITSLDNLTKEIEDLTNLSKDIESNKRYRILMTVFNSLKEDCREVLFAFYGQDISLKEIAEEQGYSDDYARQKRKRCMDNFKEKALNALKKLF